MVLSFAKLPEPVIDALGAHTFTELGLSRFGFVTGCAEVARDMPHNLDASKHVRPTALKRGQTDLLRIRDVGNSMAGLHCAFMSPIFVPLSFSQSL